MFRADCLFRALGWVTYVLTAVVGGKIKFMPPSDYPCKLLNAEYGRVHDNSSWIIGRIVRDFDYWMSEETQQRLTI
jgi:hypothetical protein